MIITMEQERLNIFLSAFQIWIVMSLPGLPAMGGDYHGYDGPYPPWNARAILHYIVTLYALDIGRLPVSGRFSGQNFMQAMDEHIQKTTEILTNCPLNPAMA